MPKQKDSNEDKGGMDASALGDSTAMGECRGIEILGVLNRSTVGEKIAGGGFHHSTNIIICT